jgi:hypothetical protein
MTKVRRPAVSPIERRKQQIHRELDKVREQTATKTRRDFESDKGYAEWKRRVQDKVFELDSELAALDCPGEYEELPLAVVAEELGVGLERVSVLLSEVDTKPLPDEGNRRNWVSRAVLERALELGAEELQRLSDQESAEIFDEAIPYFHAGNISMAEKEFRRIEVRDSWEGSHAPACRVALSLLKGDLSEARRSMTWHCERDTSYGSTILPYVGRLLRGMKLEEHGAEVLREQILAVTEGKKLDPYDYLPGSGVKKIGKHQNHIQQRTMFISTSVQNALKRYKFIQQFRSYHNRSSAMREEEFENLIRDAIYTALHAEATYNDSAASKAFVDSTLGSIPRWWVPAEPLALFPSADGAQ